MTEEQIVDLLEQLISNYPNTKIKSVEKMIEVWQMAFGENEAEDIYKAARLHMETSEFFPTVAEINNNIEKAKLIYSNPTGIEAPQARIEAPTSSYVEDMINIEGVIEDIFNDEPSEECLKCKKYSKCYGKRDPSTDVCHG
jgi:hypothetical protein